MKTSKISPRVLVLSLLAGLLGLFLLTGCESSPDQMEVARVDGQPIYLSEVQRTSTFEDNVRNVALQHKLEQKASEAGITVSEEDVDNRIQELREQQGIESDEEWQQMVYENFFDEQELRDRVKTELLIRRLAEQQIDLSDETLREEWEANQAMYRQFYNRNQDQQLSQEELENLTFEDVKDFMRETMKSQEMRTRQQELMQQLQNETEIQLTYLPEEVRQRRQSVQEEVEQAQQEQQQAMQEARERVAGSEDDIRAVEQPPESEGEGEASGEQDSEGESGEADSGEQSESESGEETETETVTETEEDESESSEDEDSDNAEDSEEGSGDGETEEEDNSGE